MLVPGIVLGIYVTFCIGVTVRQRQLMYFPCRETLTGLQARAEANQFESWHNGRGEFIGWKRLITNRPTAGQVLILHGNAGCALDRTPYADALQRVAPLDVYILEYPGYGCCAGSPSETSIFRAATEAISLPTLASKTYLIGESLGTGVACYLAGTSAQSVAGVLLIAPYNNMTSVAQHHMRIFPVRWMLKDKYRSDLHLKNYPGPVAFLLAGRDTVVPSRFGRRLYEGYGGPKKLWEEPGAGHDEIHDMNFNWWKEVIGFWEENGQAASKTTE